MGGAQKLLKSSLSLEEEAQSCSVQTFRWLGWKDKHFPCAPYGLPVNDSKTLGKIMKKDLSSQERSHGKFGPLLLQTQNQVIMTHYLITTQNQVIPFSA